MALGSVGSWRPCWISLGVPACLELLQVLYDADDDDGDVELGSRWRVQWRV